MYWLKTYNNLPHSKTFYGTMDELLADLKIKIRDGEQHERDVRRDRVELNFKENIITSSDRNLRLAEIKEWKGFTMSDLISDPEDKCLSHVCSIVVCKCTDDCVGKYLTGA